MGEKFNTKNYEIFKHMPDIVFVCNFNLEIIWSNEKAKGLLKLTNLSNTKIELFKNINYQIDKLDKHDLSSYVRFQNKESDLNKNIEWTIQSESSRANSDVIIIGREIDHLISEKEEIYELRLREKYLSTIIESEPACVKIITEEGNLVDMNPAGLELIEADHIEDVRGVSVYNLMEGESLKNFKKLNERVFSGETCSLDFEITGLKGTKHSLRTYASPLKNDMGKVVSHVAVTHDVTNEKRKELELSSALKQAEKAKLAKSEFLANMSHEIRTPMNGVLGMTELLMETKLDSEQYSLLQSLQFSTNSLLRIINDILDFSKIHAGRLELRTKPISIRYLMKKIELMFTSQFEKIGLEFIVEVNSKVPDLLLLDADRLSQVLINLLGNSAKFTKHGYVVAIVDLTGDGELRFIVSDSGIGIAPERQKLIFESFTQCNSGVDRIYGGTGLGLAISLNIIKLMNGKINLKSKPGLGSAFFFSISIQEAEDADAEILNNSDKRRFKTKVKTCNILLAEDNPINQKLAIKLLEKAGHNVTLAYNGTQAVEIFKNQDFDMILMDIQMPKMGGEEATQLIRSTDKGKNIPIVAVTAYAMASDREIYLNQGMDSYISKPYTKRKLLDTIQEVLHI